MIRLRPLSLSLILIIGLLAVGSSFAEQQRVRRNVEIEFEAIEGASQYEIQVRRKDQAGKKPLHFRTRVPKWSASIKPGLYIMQIRSFDDRGAPGSWSPPTDLQVRLPAVIPIAPEDAQTLKSQVPDRDEVKLKWEAIPDAEKYKVTIKSKNSDFKVETTTTAPEWTGPLPVAEDFEWNAVGIDRAGENGEVSEKPYGFELKGPPIPKPRLDRPRGKYVREITWRAPANAGDYDVELQRLNRKTKTWEPVSKQEHVTDNSFPIDFRQPSGRYKISVRAQSPRREGSTAAEMDFSMKGGFTDQASFDRAILRDSITRNTNFYAIASYLITDINYKSANYDNNTSATFSALGGTGRLGLGYQAPDSDWGGFGIADLSGFVIKGQNFKFASLEGHLTRRLEFGQSGLLLFGTGLFFKEIPIVLGTGMGDYTGTGKVSEIGPHAGIVYWMPVSDHYGIQLNARLYYGLAGNSSTGGKTQGSLSYQIGALGSYRISADWMGYAGYAYRLDQANFTTSPGAQSYATSGQINTVSVTGHYLNLILEYGF